VIDQAISLGWSILPACIALTCPLSTRVRTAGKEGSSSDDLKA
jgi:hypothetical protein